MCFQGTLAASSAALGSVAAQPPPADDHLQRQCGRTAGEQLSAFLQSQGRQTFSMAEVAAAQPDDLMKAAGDAGAAGGALAWLAGFAEGSRPRSAPGGSAAGEESDVPSGWTGSADAKEQRRRRLEMALRWRSRRDGAGEYLRSGGYWPTAPFPSHKEALVMSTEEKNAGVPTADGPTSTAKDEQLAELRAQVARLTSAASAAGAAAVAAGAGAVAAFRDSTG